MALSQTAPEEDEAKVAPTGEPAKPADAVNQQVKKVAKSEEDGVSLSEKPPSGGKKTEPELTAEQKKLQEQAQKMFAGIGVDFSKDGLKGVLEEGGPAGSFALVLSMMTALMGKPVAYEDMLADMEKTFPSFGTKTEEPKVADAKVEQKPDADGAEKKPEVVQTKPQETSPAKVTELPSTKEPESSPKQEEVAAVAMPSTETPSISKSVIAKIGDVAGDTVSKIGDVAGDTVSDLVSTETKPYLSGINGGALTTLVSQAPEPSLVVNAAEGISNLPLSGDTGAFNVKADLKLGDPDVTLVDPKVEPVGTMATFDISTPAASASNYLKTATPGG